MAIGAKVQTDARSLEECAEEPTPEEESVPHENPELAAIGASSRSDQLPMSPPSSQFSSEETVLIFDWDDTVLPSTWVQSQGLRLDDGSQVTDWQREQLAEVAAAAAETLQIAKQLGSVVFVTNAEQGWIELSCKKFMPDLVQLLGDIKVVSARTTYETARVNSPLTWKLLAFEAEISQFYDADCDKRKNVLSLGDSINERKALLKATAHLPNCRSKSLKFVERPDIGQICRQHLLVRSCFDHIVHHDGNLDLCIRCV